MSLSENVPKIVKMVKKFSKKHLTESEVRDIMIEH